MFKLGTRSKQRLQGVDPRLVSVVERAIQISPVDFTVLEGVRTQERQAELYAIGRTKPGKIVTWTMESKHIEGKAVDIAPCDEKGNILWNDLAGFDKISIAMFNAAVELKHKIRWGADWNQNGIKREKGESDSPHFELV